MNDGLRRPFAAPPTVVGTVPHLVLPGPAMRRPRARRVPDTNRSRRYSRRPWQAPQS